MKFDSFKGHEMSKPQGLDGLRWIGGFVDQKRRWRIVFKVIVGGTIPLKPSTDD
jgi:hypothetical protein